MFSPLQQTDIFSLVYQFLCSSAVKGLLEIFKSFKPPMFSDNHPAWFCTVWTGNGNTHHNRRIPSIGLSENQKQLWSRSFTIKSCYSPSPDMKKDFLSCFSLRTDQIHLLLKCHFIKSIAYRSSSILKNRCMFEVSCIIYSRRDEPTRTSSTQTTFHSQILVPFQLIAIHTHKSY